MCQPWPGARVGPVIVQGGGLSGFRQDGPQRPLPLASHLPLGGDTVCCYLHVIFLLYWLELVLVYVTPKTEGDRVGDRPLYGRGSSFWGGSLVPLKPPALFKDWQDTPSSLPWWRPLSLRIPWQTHILKLQEFRKRLESLPSCSPPSTISAEDTDSLGEVP